MMKKAIGFLAQFFFYTNDGPDQEISIETFLSQNEYQEMSDMTRSHTLVWQVSQVGGVDCDESEMNLCLSLTLLLVFGLALVLVLKH